MKSAKIKVLEKNMFYFIILFLEVGILFFLSRKMSKALSFLMSIDFMSFLLLPGVVIHELSHLFASVALFVPVGNMEFTPKKSGNGLKLGSIEIAKTDPIRRSIIGFAPVFLGLLLVIGIVYFFSVNILFFKDKSYYVVLGSVLGIAYLLFAISNTMFSSSRDMEGTAEILITLLIIFILSYILGFRIPVSFVENLLTESVLEMIQKSAIFLTVPIAIDLFILGIIKMFTGSRRRFVRL